MYWGLKIHSTSKSIAGKSSFSPQYHDWGYTPLTNHQTLIDTKKNKYAIQRRCVVHLAVQIHAQSDAWRIRIRNNPFTYMPAWWFFLDIYRLPCQFNPKETHMQQIASASFILEPIQPPFQLCLPHHQVPEVATVNSSKPCTLGSSTAEQWNLLCEKRFTNKSSKHMMKLARDKKQLLSWDIKYQYNHIYSTSITSMNQR